jgi:hypothetical protein
MPKIMGEIIKNGQTYNVEPLEQQDLKAAYTELLGVAQGKEYFESFDTEKGVLQILDLGNKPYDHIKVYYEKSAEPEIEPPQVEEPEREGGNHKITFGAKVNYLGQRLYVKVKHIVREGSSFAMLLEVDSRDPIAALSESGYTQVLNDVCREQGFHDPYIVVPPGQMEAEDRATYLDEYVDNIVKKADELKERGGKTATAWNGWNDPGNKQQEDGEE